MGVVARDWTRPGSAASNGASTKPNVLWLPTSNARSVGIFDPIDLWF